MSCEDCDGLMHGLERQRRELGELRKLLAELRDDVEREAEVLLDEYPPPNRAEVGRRLHAIAAMMVSDAE